MRFKNLKRWWRTTWLGHELIFCPKCNTMPADWNKQRMVYDNDTGKLKSFYCPDCNKRFEAKDGIFLAEELKKSYKDIFGFDQL